MEWTNTWFNMYLNILEHALQCSPTDQPVTSAFDWQLWAANSVWSFTKPALSVPYKGKEQCPTEGSISVWCIRGSLWALKSWQWSWFVAVFWQPHCLAVWLMPSIYGRNRNKISRIRTNHLLTRLRHQISSNNSLPHQRKCRPGTLSHQKKDFTVAKWKHCTGYNAGLLASLLQSVRP